MLSERGLFVHIGAIPVIADLAVIITATGQKNEQGSKNESQTSHGFK
jgi:hypothetical protein